MSIVERVKFLANKKKISIAELERSVDLGGGTISRWDKRIPGVDKVQKVADYFNVSIDYLLGRTNNPNVNNDDDSSNEDILIAARIREDLSEEEKEVVMQYIEFLKSKHSNE